MSEIFPLEVRAKAIAVFFAIAQCFGALGPVIYGALIGDGSEPFKLFLGYLARRGRDDRRGLVAWFLAVDAEGRSLVRAAFSASWVVGNPPTCVANSAAQPGSNPPRLSSPVRCTPMPASSAVCCAWRTTGRPPAKLRTPARSTIRCAR